MKQFLRSMGGWPLTLNVDVTVVQELPNYFALWSRLQCNVVSARCAQQTSQSARKWRRWHPLRQIRPLLKTRTDGSNAVITTQRHQHCRSYGSSPLCVPLIPSRIVSGLERQFIQ
ncbi:Uncharacterized protein HZ326_30689 [Fusarium oxysporum f. sp. albedinis]|nr:Uncharacterized protein HZ326_30689 [Fusarium oxysporum f. sp. albedinis]